MNKTIYFNLSARSDEYGFYSGTVWNGENHINFDVLPPEDRWHGGQVLEGYAPDLKYWTVYARGKPVAEVERRKDVRGVVSQHLHHQP